MTKTVFLDAGPLSMVTHPKGGSKNKQAAERLKKLIQNGFTIIIPEIADYEVRRELLRAGKDESINRLDQFKKLEPSSGLIYLPLSTDAILRAAQFWANARNQGKPTSDDKSLDADVILAGQAVTYSSLNSVTVIATTNVKHLGIFVNAQEWSSIQ